MSEKVVVAVALDGAGWHPAAWRDERSEPAETTRLRYWTKLIQEAERGGVDFVTLEDAFVLDASAPRGGAPDARRVGGRLDALLIASAVAPSTSRIGLIPTVTTTHTEPFHVATALQTLDHVSRGRAGWRLQVGARPAEADLFGRRSVPQLELRDLLDPVNAATIAEFFDEAADVVEVVRRLWDSWEDDAVVRDLPTGRYLDRDRIHNAEFEGRWFGVKGASIVPRPPQGQLAVTLLAHREEPYELAARQGDLVYVTPHDDVSAAEILAAVRGAEARVSRAGEPLRVYADLLVLLDESEAEARDALARLDELAGSPLKSDALILATSVAALVERVKAWRDLGYDGFRLRPARLPADLVQISSVLLPALAAAGLHTVGDDRGPLRARLGLAPAENRYAANRTTNKTAEVVA